MILLGRFVLKLVSQVVVCDLGHILQPPEQIIMKNFNDIL